MLNRNEMQSPRTAKVRESLLDYYCPEHIDMSTTNIRCIVTFATEVIDRVAW
jgi:hypothetical protein